MIQSDLAKAIGAGLQRRAVTTCSRWAEAYRIMGPPHPGRYSFKYHPWCREMHDCEAELMIGQKGAQLGFTEVALNKTFFALDIRSENALYVLPNDNPDAGNFSASRFNPAIEASKHIRGMFSDVNNVGMKRAGGCSLFVVGSKSRSRLKSNPCAFCACDEVEEMNQANIALIPERMAGQEHKQMFMLSTPSLPGVGINKYYIESSEEHFMFRCPYCSRGTELTYPDCLVVTGDDPNHPDILNSHLICKECKHVLPQESKHEWLKDGWWEATNLNRLSRGFHVSQMYASNTKPYHLAAMSLMTDPADVSEFYNSKLGLPCETKGARITETQFNGCIGPYTKLDNAPSNALVTMGVDVGEPWNHVVIDQWFFEEGINSANLNQKAVAKLLWEGKVQSFTELDVLLRQYNVAHCVIDKQPEVRMTKELANKYPGLIHRCEYNRGERGGEVRVKDQDGEFIISVDRNSWLDLSLGRIRSGRYRLPKDISAEFRLHLMNIVKVYKKNSDGNTIARYEEAGTGGDHFAHARNYSEMALRFAASFSKNENIEGIL